MSTTTTNYFEQIEANIVETDNFVECRVCLENTNDSGCPLTAALVLETDQGEVLSLLDILAQICAVHVEADDGLPDVICDYCKDTLISAYKLQLTAQNSDAVLRERAKKPLSTTGDVKLPDMMIVEDPVQEEGEVQWKAEENDDGTVSILDDQDQSEAGDVYDDLVAEDGHQPAKVKREPGKVYPQCETCGKQFTKAYYLNRHKEVHVMDPNRPYQCPVCYHRFHIESTLKLHMQIHDSSLVEANTTQVLDTFPVVYRCQECEAEFSSCDAFDEHWKSHLGEDDEEAMEDNNCLQESELVEGDEEQEEVKFKAPKSPAKEYKCQCCSKIYHNLNLFARHVKKQHPDRATHQCTLCGLLFPLGSQLNEHLQAHKGVKKFECSQCDKTFRLAGSLKDHERAHADERPYLCPDCGKGFHSRGNLRQHQLRHNEEKKYACDECPSTFVTKSSLNSHKRIHSGAKPYQCPDCDRAFNTHFSWSKHKRTHSGEKPYVCEICGMRFNSSYHVTVSSRLLIF